MIHVLVSRSLGVYKHSSGVSGAELITVDTFCQDDVLIHRLLLVLDLLGGANV